MSLRPEFCRSLRHLPLESLGQVGEAANELQGLVHDLAIRLMGSASRAGVALSRGMAGVAERLQRKTVWHHRGAVQTEEIGTPVSEATPRTLLSAFSTDDLENIRMPPVRRQILNRLSRVAPSPHHRPLVQEGPAQHEQLIRVAEMMAMDLAYHCPADAQRTDLPLGDGNAPIGYQIEVVPMAMGLQAFGFIPERPDAGPPILLFRGTVTSPNHRSAGTTWVADLDPLGVGWGFYRFGAGSIETWLKKAVERTGRKAVAIGHSLGGAHATYAGVYNPQFVDKTLTFNPPAVSFLAKQRWDELKRRGAAPAVWNFINTRDDISFFGQEVVGEDYFIHVDPQAAAGPAFNGGNLWAGHAHHSNRMLMHPHIAVAGKRTLSRLRYLLSFIAIAPFIMMYALLLMKRLMVGHQSASRYSYLLGWVAVILAALATVSIQTAVLVKLGANRLAG